MSSQRVQVTYTASVSFQASESWKRIREALSSQLPLRNVHWKPTSLPSLRTIQELDITLDSSDTLRDELTSQVPVTILEKPLLHIYIVTCEEFDLELYKSSIKKQIKEWLAGIAQRKNQEWLILHVVRPDSRVPSGNFFQLKGSVLDKIRTDFNVDKRDRCVQLLWSVNGNDNLNPAVWADLMTKMRDGILSALDSAISQRDEEVKRSESQKQMPGWNFCTFFILKESLASSFEGVSLFEDALQQYDELEACFHQVLKEAKLSWFGTLISPSDGDDSAPLLSISKKSYRTLILANTISEFDFRVYLLACQCALLSKMGRLHEVCRRAAAFLTAFSRRLRGVEADLPGLFVESWIFSSALSVVDQSDAWAIDLKLEGVDLASFNAGKGELLELALDQLKIIGIRSGHLHSSFPMKPQSSDPSNPQITSSPKVTHPELAPALVNDDSFHGLCVKIANCAIDVYTKAGRHKFALKLRGTLAAVDFHCGRLSDAVDAYKSLAADYAQAWPSLQSFTLSRALDIHADLGKPKDVEWIRFAVAYLDTCADSTVRQPFLHQERVADYTSDVITDLKSAAERLESNTACIDHSIMSFELSSVATIAETEGGSFLDTTITNQLPCTIPIEGISIVLIGRDDEQLRFVSAAEPLQPGKTSVRLFCPTSSSGTYELDSSEARISHLLFQRKYRTTSAKGTRKPPILIQVPRDPRALDIRIRRPHLIELGTAPQLLVVICTGKNRITKATIKLSGPVGFRLRYREAVLQSQDSTCLQIEDDCAKVVNVAARQSVPILIPHSDASAFQVVKVTACVEYFTADQPAVRRTLRTTGLVMTALPIAVNVQDYFRGTRLFSKFTIASTSHQHVRISSAQLRDPQGGVKGVHISSSLTEERVVTVTPSKSANFLFQLDSKYGPVRESLKLVIKYRMLREEVETLIQDLVDESISKFPSLLAQRDVLVDGLVKILESDASWVELYGITGELAMPDVDGGPKEHQDCLNAVKERLRLRRHPRMPAGEWHEIIIPVDVPRMTVVAAAQISISSTMPSSTSTDTTAPLYAGQPIAANLSIHTSFHWGTSAGDKECKFLMQFDVEEMIRDWLVSGQKRGDFAAMDGVTFTVPLTLVALHHGEIALPKIAITAVDGSNMGSMSLPSVETYQLHGAERVLVLPRGGRSTFVLNMED